MLKIGDKIEYVRTNGFMDFPLGTVFTVKDIKGTVLAVEAHYQVDGLTVGNIQGVMSYDEYEKYFDKHIEEQTETTSAYTKWETYDYSADIDANVDCANCLCNLLCHYQDVLEVQYKHNNKKLAIKAKLAPTNIYPYAPDGKVLTVYTTCHPEDEFNLEKGLRIGLEKLNKKIAQQIVKTVNKNLENC